MIVIHRMEVTDAERSALSLRLHPKAPKRLATGKEIKQYQSEGWAKITAPDRSDSLHISNKPASTCGFTDCDNPSSHTWSGHPTCEDHRTPMSKPPFVPVDHPKLKGSDQKRMQGKTGLRSALLSVNNAMFSISNARRQLTGETWNYIEEQAASIVAATEALRATLVELHDEECQD